LLSKTGPSGAQLEILPVDFATLKTPEFLKKNPNGKVPVLETPEGPVFESNAILRHFGRLGNDKHLYGTTEFEHTLVDQWIDWNASELDGPIMRQNLVIAGWHDFDKEKNKKDQVDGMKSLRILENHLKVSSHVVGNHLTIADLAIAQTLYFSFRFSWDEKFRTNAFPSITKWFQSIAQHPSFVHVHGKVRLCQTPFETPQIEKTVQPVAPKKEQPKKEEKKPKKDDDDEDDTPKEKSEKNPLDSLPASTFNLFDFKTLFVNAPNKDEAVKFFFDNFDPKGYSIYFVHYIKAEGEGKVFFLTNNLKNGFLQRLDHFRKYAFGVHGVYGEEPNLEIQGVWVWRGEGIPAEIKELDSYEYHNWTKLDPSKEEDRKKVSEYWTHLNEDEIADGVRVRDAKYFK